MTSNIFNFYSRNRLDENLGKEYDYERQNDDDDFDDETSNFDDNDDETSDFEIEPELTEEYQKRREELEKENEFYEKMSEKLVELQDINTEDDQYDHNYVRKLIDNHEIIPIEYDKRLLTQEFIETHFRLINYNFNSDFVEHTFTFNNLNFYIKENLDDGMFYNNLSIPLILINNLDQYVINNNGAFNNEELVQQIIYNFMLVNSFIDVVKVKSNDKTLNLKIKQHDYQYLRYNITLHKKYYDFDISFLSFSENKKIVKPNHIREYIQNKCYNLIFDLIVSKIGSYNKIVFFDIREYLTHNIYDNAINYESLVNSKFSYHKFFENKIFNE